MKSTEYYKILTESINKKYLKEAWSDSMPDWMKPRLNATAMFSDRDSAEKMSRTARKTGRYVQELINQKGQGFGYDRADYMKSRSTGERGKNLYTSFINAGVDLQNVEFIEGDLPTSKNDERIQPPNIGIWNIPSTGQIYAKGINDSEKLLSGTGTKYTDYPFFRMPIKGLAEISDKFCYIDGSSIVNRDVNEIKRERRAYKQWEKNNPSLNRNVYNPWGREVDKSGYQIVPSSERLRDELNKRKAKSWSSWFEKAEDELKSLYNDIGSAMMSQPWDNKSFSITIQQALDVYDSAVGKYKDAMETLQRLISNWGQDTDEFLSRIGNEGYYSARWYLNQANDYIKRARSYVDKYVLTNIDF